jgi:putative CocE/NonD family hydrolase
MSTNALRQVRHIETEWITMPDGCRLAARIWLPEDAEQDPVPAILEHIPYRRRDFTRLRGDDTHAYWAARGYACLRIDIRGSGDSEGLIEDEYCQQELDDAVSVIAWAAAQSWCSGSVGMMGISWGGFNGLQVAALRPPALKAVITACSTDDRYADDIHYMGGCPITENLSWASTMFGFNSRPPDPDVVGDAWRAQWLERLEETPPWLHWLQHQRRDGLWKHGSVCEDYSRIQAAVYAVGGWADGYTNAIPRLLAGLSSPRKALIGPWPHAWPHLASPGPRIGWLQEALRWWDHWLKGRDTGIMDEPMMRVWMQEGTPPAPQYTHRPGRWVAEVEWPSPRIIASTLHLNAARLGETPQPETVLIHRSPQTHGLHGGEWCPYGQGAEMPEDQRLEDGQAMAFEGAPVTDRLEILGATVLDLEIAVDQPVAFLCARLIDVAPDGAAQQVTYGLLNLTHDPVHETVTPLTPGQRFKVRIQLNDIAHSFAPGHRLRLALATSFWPRAWPSPQPVTLTLFTGASRMILPVRPPDTGDARLPDFATPESAPSGAHSQLRPVHRSRVITRSVADGMVEIVAVKDRGDTHLGEIDLTIGACGIDRYRITGDDPLSARHETEYTIDMRRGEWQIRTVGVIAMTATAADFLLSATMDAYEGDTRVFTKSWTRKIPRDGC